MGGTFTNLLVHVTFSTKNRLPLIGSEIEGDLHKYMGGIIRKQGCTLFEVNGMNDHVHLLLKLKPSLALSDLIRDVKANSSKWVNEEKWKVHKFGWQDGFAAFSVSRSQIEKVAEYIRNQKEHHQGLDFKSELLGLLIKHEIEFDEEYLWN